MGNNSQLIIALAMMTLVSGVAAALIMRIRVAHLKGNPKRSSFVQNSQEPMRQNRPGTEH